MLKHPLLKMTICVILLIAFYICLYALLGANDVRRVGDEE